MRLVTFVDKTAKEQTGLLLGEHILPLASAVQAAGIDVDVSSVLAIVRGGAESIRLLAGLVARAGEFRPICVAVNTVRLLAPIPDPLRNIFCVGRNYVDHIKEGMPGKPSEVTLPEVPQFFTKATHTVNAPHGDVRLDTAITSRLDYEVELAVVIGKGGRHIKAADWKEHVFGYMNLNDVSARDVQLAVSQWVMGKTFDTFAPMGPWLVTADEVEDPHNLTISLTVNGETLQNSNTKELIFKIPELVEFLSSIMTLEPGDIVSTGTPSGVGFSYNPPKWLKPGDEVVVRVQGLGELRNICVAE